MNKEIKIKRLLLDIEEIMDGDRDTKISDEEWFILSEVKERIERILY